MPFKHNLNNTSTSWLDIAAEIMLYGSLEKSRLGDINEIVNFNASFKNPTLRYINPVGRNFNLPFAITDFVDIMLGHNPGNAKFFNSKMNNYLNENGIFDGAYGPRIQSSKFTSQNQFDRCYYELSRFPDSRRAVINIFDSHQENFDGKDVACTISLQFLLRDKKLHLITTMRSEDVFLGYCYDTFIFQTMQSYMAALLGCELGTYYHNVGSLHLYVSDIDKLKMCTTNLNTMTYSHSAPCFITLPIFYKDLMILDSIIDDIVKNKLQFQLVDLMINNIFDKYYTTDLVYVMIAEYCRRNKMYDMMNVYVSKIRNEYVDYFEQKMQRALM